MDVGLLLHRVIELWVECGWHAGDSGIGSLKLKRGVQSLDKSNEVIVG